MNGFFVDLLGLEPKKQDPESCVLPITPQVNMCCPTRIRTWTGRTKICSATITPSDKKERFFLGLQK